MRSQKNVLFYQGNCNNNDAKLALVSVSVESSLLGHDVESYEKVAKLLESRYDCCMCDCYNHPDYLNEILKTLPSDSYYSIVESIRRGLGEFTYIDGISKFLDELKK
ncbi:MAG TPA: hypothetical protein VFX64_07685 [Candidatus Nitrosotalea sp.]|nr:hypothetical protein [Candidatus Nitrosotalea sp.]